MIISNIVLMIMSSTISKESAEALLKALTLIKGNEREAFEFQSIDRGNNAWFPRKRTLGKRILVDIRMLLVI
jgi:hypothetical protein